MIDVATAGALVPPRPNLGPEPMPRPTEIGPAGLLILLTAALGLLALAGVGVRRRRRRPAPDLDPQSALVPDQDPVVAWADRVRQALAVRLGPAWPARTTEEIADAPDLEALIGPERRAFLLRLLREADRLKFGGGPESDPAPRTAPTTANPFDPDSDDWAAWVGGLLAVLERPASAVSWPPIKVR